MANEVSQQNSLLSNAKSAFVSSAVMSGGFGSLSAVKRFGVKGAIEKAHLNSEILRDFAKKHNKDVDFFTRGYATAKNYDELARARKNLAKLKKITESDSGITFFQKIKKVFTKKDYKALNKASFNEADELLNGVIDKKTGKVVKEGLEANLRKGVDALEITSKSFGKNLGGLFKSELKDPFGIFFAGTEFVERFTSSALPAFKEKGFTEGMKETGEAVAAAVATWATDAGLSVFFRTTGAAIGGIIGPIGATVGSVVGNAIGGMLSWSIVEKLFPKEEKPQEQTQETAITQAPAQNEQPTFQGAQQTNNLNVNENRLTEEQVKKLAYAKAFSKYGATNSQLQKYYA